MVTKAPKKKVARRKKIKDPDCKKCGEPIKHTADHKGPRRQYHAWCTQRRSRPEALESIRRQEGEEAYQAAKAKAPDDDSKRPRIRSYSEMMAIGLSINSNPMEAARVTGLDDALPQKEIDALAKLAKKRHQPLIDGDSGEIARIVQQALCLLVVRMRDSINTMPETQMGSTVKALGQVLEMMSGGIQATYNDINLFIPGPEGQTLRLKSDGTFQAVKPS